MEETKEKVNLRRLVITIVLVLITAIVVGGLVWFLMDRQAKQTQSDNEKSLKELENTIGKTKTQENEPETVVTDEFASWKTFYGPGFTIKYPGEWKIEENSTNTNLVFAKTNVVFTNIPKNYSISLNYGELYGRGGSCVMRNINYEAKEVVNKIVLEPKGDISTVSLPDGEMCGGQVLKGFVISTNWFNYSNKELFGYSYGASSDKSLSDEANVYFKKIIETLSKSS